MTSKHPNMISENTVHTRLAVEADLAEINAMYNKALVASAWIHDHVPNTATQRQEWFRAKQSQGMPVFVAELNGKIVGFSALNPFMSAAYDTTVHTSVYVADGHQGLGLGKRLINTLIEWAQDHKKHTVLAGINANNAPSIRVHEALGFVEIGSFRQVLRKFDEWQDLKFYQLMLD